MKSYKVPIFITSLIVGFCLISIDRKDAFSQSLEWVQETSMLTARDSFTGGVINGKIYVFGGNGNPNGFNLKSTEMFDPVTHSWTYKASNENNAGQGVEELSGVVLNDKLYVFGAWGGGTPYGTFNFVQEYNPAIDAWTSKAPKPTTVTGATAALYNGEIFLFGGGYTSGTNPRVYYDVVEAYNPISNTWRTVTNMPYNLQHFSLSIFGAKAYLIGGLDRNTNNLQKNVIAYDFESNQWITEGLGTLPMPRIFSSSSSAPIVNGKSYLIGGLGSNVGWDVTGESDISLTNEVLIYDPSTQSFSSGPHIPQANFLFLALVINNSIYVIGGQTDRENDIRTSAVWRLDLAPKPNIAPVITLLLTEECSELSETWHLELSDGSGSGEVILKQDSNCEVTSSGSLTATYSSGSYVFDVTLEYQSDPIENLSGGEYVSKSTGTASLVNDPSVTADFESTTTGVVSKGVGIGQSVSKYTAPGWPETTIQNFVMTRIEGSGITPETGYVDLNEGSDEQFLLCVSNCSSWGFLITNSTKEPISTIQHTIYHNDYTNRLSTFDGDIRVHSTEEVILEFSGTHYWSPLCYLEVEVIGFGSCQTNPF